MNDVQLAYFRHAGRAQNGILANAGETTEHLRGTVVPIRPTARP